MGSSERPAGQDSRTGVWRGGWAAWRWSATTNNGTARWNGAEFRGYWSSEENGKKWVLSVYSTIYNYSRACNNSLCYFVNLNQERKFTFYGGSCVVQNNSLEQYCLLLFLVFIAFYTTFSGCTVSFCTCTEYLFIFRFLFLVGVTPLTDGRSYGRWCGPPSYARCSLFRCRIRAELGWQRTEKELQKHQTAGCFVS